MMVGMMMYSKPQVTERSPEYSSAACITELCLWQVYMRDLELLHCFSPAKCLEEGKGRKVEI